MKILIRALMAGASVVALFASSAEAGRVLFDPPATFSFYVNDPSYGFEGPDGVMVYPISGYGYQFPGVDWVDFGTNGRTLTFGQGDVGGYQLTAPKILWTETPIVMDNRVEFEVTFGPITSSPPQTLDWVNPATGATTSVTVNPLPEPATWAFMLIGSALVGAGIRRGRRLVA